ncbi:Toll/interleukin-1 receptor domain-containing protein, partial [Tanacetum coccineum]
GEDTRKTFVDHLYEALQDKCIYTYKDDEKIAKGVTIDNQLTQAIKDSRFSIIVFSKNYASSSWCLDELVKIMECHKMNIGHTVYPVYYDVEPTEVRKQSRAVGKAFARHENKEAAGKWREALKEAANLVGWELKTTANGHEAKFINKIAQGISLELRSINLGPDENIFGTGNRVRDAVSHVEMLVDDARMLGIKGMGRAVKLQKLRSKAKSFVRKVREVSKASNTKNIGVHSSSIINSEQL